MWPYGRRQEPPMRNASRFRSTTLLLPILCGVGCTGDRSTGNSLDDLEVPERYAFTSRFDGAESVSYAGQTVRQVLIQSMKAEFVKIGEEMEFDGAVFMPGDVTPRLDFYYNFDSDSAGSLPHSVTTEPAPLQASFDDISAGKDLRGKIAGNDPIGQYKAWSTEGIVGWGQNQPSPDALVTSWFNTVSTLATDYSNGLVSTDPNGVAIPVWYVDAEGRDYQQLLEKFLLGAINYSQAADDYLDDDIDGKGLRSDNLVADEGTNYTALEHAWDEGFGYWGAARDYLAYDDEALAENPAHDHDEDGAIDMLSEYSFGAARNASKRDLGAAPEAPTDLSGSTMKAFLTGRAIISNANGALDQSELEALMIQRDLAIEGWERSLAATAIHYINDTLRDLSDPTTKFETLAKHWSELKGFTLALQFNPRMLLSDDHFATLHELIGDAPSFESQYPSALLTARTMLAETYGFEAANVGDDLGEGGW